MIRTPGAWIGTHVAITYVCSKTFIVVFGGHQLVAEGSSVMCSFAPRMTTPSGVRSTTT